MYTVRKSVIVLAVGLVYTIRAAGRFCLVPVCTVRFCALLETKYHPVKLGTNRTLFAQNEGRGRQREAPEAEVRVRSRLTRQ